MQLHVVLDTNVLVGDWMLDSPAGQTLLAESHSGRIRLCVPTIVLGEVRRKYRQRLKWADRQLREALRDRRQVDAGAPDPALDRIIVGVDADAAAQRYIEALTTRLTDAGAVVLPLPDVPHADVLDRALGGKSPFDQTGRTGYRDTLIWHSVLELAHTASSVVLVTNDGDFADTSGGLAGSLAEEASALGTGDQSFGVVLCKTVAQLIQTEFGKESDLLFQLNEHLRTDRQFFLAVREQLDGAWIGSAPDLEVDGDIELEWTDSELDMVNDVFDDFLATSATEADDERAFVQLRAHADIQIRYEIPLSSAISDQGLIRDDVEVYEGRGYGEFTDVVPADLTFEAFYIPGADSLEDLTLVRIRENRDWVEEGRILGRSPER